MNKKYQDPLIYLYNKYGFDINQIQKITFGEKYVAILLANGNIGLCATLFNTITDIEINEDSIDPNKIEHRIILNAYYNAIINPNNDYKFISDIFDRIEFKTYKNIVMIGYFKSLVEKFSREQIPLNIFDHQKLEEELLPMTLQEEKIVTSDAIILTATSIFNKTFTSIVNRANKDCDIYILGPSAIMYPEFLKIYPIKMAFGMIFTKNDNRITDVIKAGNGTPSFQKFAKKVFIM